MRYVSSSEICRDAFDGRGVRGSESLAAWDGAVLIIFCLFVLGLEMFLFFFTGESQARGYEGGGATWFQRDQLLRPSEGGRSSAWAWS